MELRHLRYFLAIAAEKNFTRAAEILGIGQPPLSQQIKSLETEIGVRLFLRTSHGAHLTAAGKAFAVEAQRAIDAAEQAVQFAQRAGRGETGLLRLGFTGSAAFNSSVSGRIGSFRRRYPDVTMTLEETNTNALLTALSQNRLDAAFVRPGSDTAIGIRFSMLPDEPMHIVLPSDHRLATQRSLPMSALAGEALLMVARPAGKALFDEIMEACRHAGFEPKLGQNAPQISSVVNLVAAGLGVSVVPASITQVHVTGVTYVPVKGHGPKARLGIATREGDGSSTLENFLNLEPK